MADANDYARLRADIGADEDTLGDIEAAEIYDEAAEEYSGALSIKAATRVIALGRMLASSAKLTSYTQNNSREELGEVFKNLKQLEALWQDKLDKAVAAENEAANPGTVPPPTFTTRLRPVW